MKNGSYPKSKAKDRVFHLWDETHQTKVRHRHFRHPTNACDRAMCNVKRFGTLGQTLTVYDARTGVMVEQYTRDKHDLVITTNPIWKGRV